MAQLFRTNKLNSIRNVIYAFLIIQNRVIEKFGRKVVVEGIKSKVYTELYTRSTLTKIYNRKDEL